MDGERIDNLLRGIEMFSVLDDASLAKLAAGGEMIHLPGGDLLMREGDPSDALYVVASGRLQAFVTAESGTEKLVGEIGRGEIIGEMGVLAGESRSATVRALRDTNLVRFPKDTFVSFLHDHPEELFSITQLIIQRLRKAIRSEASGASVRTIAVVPGGPGEGPPALARYLTSVFSELRVTRLVSATDVDETISDGDMTRHLHDLETNNDLLVYLADPVPSSWTERCLRQADRVLLVVEAQEAATRTDVERRLLTPHNIAADLVLLQPDHAGVPEGAPRWLAARTVRRHHHVRLHSRDDLLRLARAMTGREVALVLSGGGARGTAHVGVVKALTELKVPVDVVGGSSFGSIVGAGIARRTDWETQRDLFWEHLASQGSVVDVTAPVVSLARGQRITERLRNYFTDAHIEDLWLPFFCLSSNLSQGEVMVHDRGPVWKALRASVSIPGLFPPVRSDTGDILVDGAVMNNLPVDVMQDVYDPGFIIAVNLKGTSALPSHGLSESGVLSGWGPLAGRFNPITDSPSLPGIVDVLFRATETGNVLAAKRNEQHADIVLHPDVAEFGLLAFDELDRVIDAGYRYALHELEQHEALLNRMR